MTALRRAATPLLALTLATGLAACGGDDGDDEAADGGATQEQAAPPAETAETQPAEREGPSNARQIARRISEELDERPQIPAPSGPPPRELQTATVVEGDGERASEGDTVRVQYVGASWSTGQEFDASWERGEAFPFELGARMVIPGWEEGVEGMRVGERRVLAIPPDLGYGAQGFPPDIAPNETLVFVVDLVAVE